MLFESMHHIASEFLDYASLLSGRSFRLHHRVKLFEMEILFVLKASSTYALSFSDTNGYNA
jgi:hypothetical protein